MQYLAFDDYFSLGSTLHQQNKLPEALEAFTQALYFERNPTGLSAVATVYSELGQFEQALPLAQEALSLLPDHPQLQSNLAVLFTNLGNFQQALDLYNEALANHPDIPIALINKGSVLIRLGKKKEALAHNKIAYERLPKVFESHFNYVDGLIQSFNYAQGLAVCQHGLSIFPDQAHLMFQKAICLSAMKEFDAANIAVEIARKANPTVIMTFLSQLTDVDKVKNLKVDSRNIYLEAKYREKQVSYWQHLDEYEAFMKDNLGAESSTDSPMKEPGYAFQILSSSLSSPERLKLAQLITHDVLNRVNSNRLKPYQHSKKEKDKIRLAYISPDFRQHAIAILTCQIYGVHDRANFEVYGYSLFNAKEKEKYREQIEANCDVFFDVAGLNTVKLAKKIFDDDIDILIDLAGYTTHSKFEVFALKPAPVQIQYLGYLATMGADYIDYAMVDSVICSEGTDAYWQEKLIRLPNSLWPYDTSISNEPTQLKRSDYGLPDHQFVFCCLNNNYKIEPLVFGKWMNILNAVPNSVLWLLTNDIDTEDNLIREAVACGVAKERLVFAHRAPLEQHVARFQLANLLLDTRWHNAHTTGAEGLWQGLPMITCMSEQTSSRGAGSMLYALEMPELVVDSFDAYEKLAIFYATHPDEYLAMREKLKAKRYTAPLFDIKLKVNHLERAYKMAWQRYQSGLPPEAINVPI